VNLLGAFNVLITAASEMARLVPTTDGERGVIVFTSSIAAYDGQIGQVAYSASKGGAARMILPAARDIASFGIRVCSIAPGFFNAPIMSSATDQQRGTYTDQVVFPHRIGSPDEFASLLGHIVSNPYLNGEVIRLDGGTRMSPK
jgi:NAD(P)-dependent dehydrogenase (short-subunit alcohol dehydrogenase family)